MQTADTPRDVSWYGNPRAHGARCDECPLSAHTFVPYMPPAKGKAKLVLVGEGPGRKEEYTKVPFSGITGRMLNDELEECGLNRDEMHVTNATLCAGENDQDNERAAECCAPRLLKELAALPKDAPIVTLGKAATRTVLGVKGIFMARGFVWTARDLSDSVAAAEAAERKAERAIFAAKGTTQKLERAKAKLSEAKLRVSVLRLRHKLAGRTIFPTLHPTFAFIHNEPWAPIFHIDLDRVARWQRRELKADDLADNVRCVDSIEELKKTERTFVVTDAVSDIDAVSKILGPEIAVDIETERIKPVNPLKAKILCVQVSDGVRGLVIGPWDSGLHRDALTRLLKGRTVIMHNGFIFDQVALERPDVAVDLSGAQIEDTLTAHHSFASHYPQRLDHVVATFLDSSPWKIRFGVRGAEEKGLAPRAEADDLYEYGAADAFVTKLAWDALQADLAAERSVYEFDKRRSVLYKSMQVVGYPVDRRRRRMLIKSLKRRAASLKGLLRHIARMPDLKPSKPGDIRDALFRKLKAPVLDPTPTGLASTSNAVLEKHRLGGNVRVKRFAEGVLNYRLAEKVVSTYLTPVPIGADGRAHYNFKPFGVITGRPASRVLSAPRWSKDLPDRFREILCAGPGEVLWYFDLAQAEARGVANLSGDPALIEACRIDFHTQNALILFAEFQDAAERLARDPKGKNCPKHSEHGSASAACNCGKLYRDVMKNVGFAILYQAHVTKIFAFLRSQGFPVELDACELMMAAMRGRYHIHNQWVQDLMRYVGEHGYLRTALKGRIVRLGYHPKPTDVSNIPIQSLIADVMDSRLLDTIVPNLPPGVRQVMHHYDSGTFCGPAKYLEWREETGKDGKVKRIPAGPVVELIESTWKVPVRLEASPVCPRGAEFMLPAEVKAGRRWSDF